MAITITKEVLRTTYELLALTRPFNKWGLPSSNEIIFKVLRTTERRGDYHKDSKGRHVIRVSQGACHTLHAVVLTVAHEMCHVKDETRADHGWRFNQLADRVCKWHHLDRGLF
jgi:predicted metal-dependent hydrolase